MCVCVCVGSGCNDVEIVLRHSGSCITTNNECTVGNILKPEQFEHTCFLQVCKEMPVTSTLDRVPISHGIYLVYVPVRLV